MKFAACFVSLLVVLIVHGSTAKPGKLALRMAVTIRVPSRSLTVLHHPLHRLEVDTPKLQPLPLPLLVMILDNTFFNI